MSNCPTSRKLVWSDCQGAYAYPDGRQYSGGFKANRREGEDVFTSFNGNKWTGVFKDDKPKGQGVLTDKKGKVLKTGVLSNGANAGESAAAAPARP